MNRKDEESMGGEFLGRIMDHTASCLDLGCLIVFKHTFDFQKTGFFISGKEGKREK